MKIKPGDLVKLRDDRWLVELMRFDPTKDPVQLIYDYVIVTEQESSWSLLEVATTTLPMLYLGFETVSIQAGQTELLNIPIRLGTNYMMHKFLHKGKIWFSVQRSDNGLMECFLPVTSSQ